MSKISANSLKDKELVRQYREQYPKALAFQNTDAGVSVDHMLLEHKLESVIDQSLQASNARRAALLSGAVPAAASSAPAGAASSSDQPPPRKIVSVDESRVKSVHEYRHERAAALADLMTPPAPEPFRLYADVLTEEVEFAGLPELSLPSIHATLLDFYRRRADTLSNLKHRHALRWARHCTTSPEARALLATFAARIDAVESERGRVLQRVERLQRVAGVPANLSKADLDLEIARCLQPDDFVEYIRWRLCHERSTKLLHRFYKRIQWLPYTHRFNVYTRVLALQRAQQDVPDRFVPMLATQSQALEQELAALQSHFKLDGDYSLDDGREFCAQATRLFAVAFQAQTQACFFPAYDSSVAQSSLNRAAGSKKDATASAPAAPAGTAATPQTSAPSASAGAPAHLKTSTWLKSKSLPVGRLSPLQQVQNAELARMRQSDPQFRVDMNFLDSQVNSYVLQRLTEGVQTHKKRAAMELVEVAENQEVPQSAFKPQQPAVQPTDAASDAPSRRLTALYHLRHLRTRDYRQRVLNDLNFLRSVERRLTLDLDPESSLKPAEFKPVAQIGPIKEYDEFAGTGSDCTVGYDPDRTPLSPLVVGQPMPPEAAVDRLNRDDFWTEDAAGDVRLKDSMGVFIMYDAALKDRDELENELMKVGSHYILQRDSHPAIDRLAVLEQLYEQEAAFALAKRRLVQTLLELYDHVPEPSEQRRTAQLIADVIALRPLYDFRGSYFVASYQSHIKVLNAQATVFRDLLRSTIDDQKFLTAVHKDERIVDKSGFPAAPEPSLHPIELSPGGAPTGLFDFHETAAVLNKLPELVQHVLEQLTSLYRPKSPVAMQDVAAVVWSAIADEWQGIQQAKHHLQLEHGGLQLEDPVWMDGVIQDFVREELAALAALSDDDLQKRRTRADGGSSVSMLKENNVAGAAVAGRPPRNFPNLYRRGVNFVGVATELAANRPEAVRKADTKSLHTADVFMNVIEALSLRTGLLDALYESEGLLLETYRDQARTLSLDIKRLDIDAVRVDQMFSNPLEQYLPKDVSKDSMSEGFVYGDLAVADFDRNLAFFDFKTRNGVRSLMTVDGVESLRVAFKTQVLRKNLLLIAVQHNQAALDPYLLSHHNKHDPGVSQAFDGEAAFNVPASGDEDLLQPPRPREATAEDAAASFLQLQTLTAPFKKSIVEQVKERYAAIIAREIEAPSLRAALHELRRQLLDGWCRDVMAAVYPYACRFQAVSVVSRIVGMLQQLPGRSKLRFVVGRPPAPGARPGTVARPEGRSEAGTLDPAGRPRSRLKSAGNSAEMLVSRDGEIKNIWFLPHYREMLGLLLSEGVLTQTRGLSTALRVLMTMRDLLNFWILQGSLVPPDSNDIDEGPDERGPQLSFNAFDCSAACTDAVAAEMNKLDAELRGLPRQGSDETLAYLARRRERAYGTFRLAMDMLCDQLARQQRFEVAAAISEHIHDLAAERRWLYDTYTAVPVVPAAVVASGGGGSPDSLFRLRALHRDSYFVGAQRESYAWLPLVLLNLESTERNAAYQQYIAVEMLLEEVLIENNVEPASQPHEALALELGFLGSSLLALRLKRAYVRLLLGLERLTSRSEYEQAESAFQKNIVARAVAKLTEADSTLLAADNADDPILADDHPLLKSGSRSWANLKHKGREQQVRKRPASAGRPVSSGSVNFARDPSRSERSRPSSRGAVAHGAHWFTGDRPLPESAVRRRVVQLLKDEVQKLQIEKNDEEARATLNRLLVDVRELQKRGSQPSAAAEEAAAKFQLVTEFANELLAQADVSDGTVRIDVGRLSTALDSFASRFSDWADQRTSERVSSLQLINQHLAHLLYTYQQNISHLDYMRLVDARGLQRRVEAELTGKGLELVNELNSCHRRIRDLQTKLENREHTISEAIRDEYAVLVRDLSLRLLDANTTLQQRQSELHQDMLGQLASIKHAAVQRIAALAAAPEVDEALREREQEEGKTRNLRLESLEWQKRYLKLKSFGKVKEVALRAFYDKSVTRIQEGQLKERRPEGESAEAVEQREAVLRKQLTTMQNALSRAELQVTGLRALLDEQQKHREELMAWKIQKNRAEAELQEKARQFDRWSHVNIDRVLVDLDKKDKELKALREQLAGSNTKPAQPSGQAQREIKQLQRQLEAETKVKTVAIQKAEQAQRERDEMQAEVEKLRRQLEEATSNARSGEPDSTTAALNALLKSDRPSSSHDRTGGIIQPPSGRKGSLPADMPGARSPATHKPPVQGLTAKEMAALALLANNSAQQPAAASTGRALGSVRKS